MEKLRKAVQPELPPVEVAGRLTTPEPCTDTQPPPQSSRSPGASARGVAAAPPAPGQGCTEPGLPGGAGTMAEPWAGRTPRRPLPSQRSLRTPLSPPWGRIPARAPARLTTPPGARAPGQPRGGRGAPLALPVQEAPGRAASGGGVSDCTVLGARPRPQRTASPGLPRRSARRRHSPPRTGEKVARGGAAARTVTPQGRPCPGSGRLHGPAPPPPAALPCPSSRPRGSTSCSGCSRTRFTSVPVAAAAAAARAAGPPPRPVHRRAAAAAATTRSLSCARPAALPDPLPGPRSPPHCLGGAVPAAGSAPDPPPAPPPTRCGTAPPRPLTDGSTARPPPAAGSPQPAPGPGAAGLPEFPAVAGSLWVAVLGRGAQRCLRASGAASAQGGQSRPEGGGERSTCFCLVPRWGFSCSLSLPAPHINGVSRW